MEKLKSKFPWLVYVLAIGFLADDAVNADQPIAAAIYFLGISILMAAAYPKDE